MPVLAILWKNSQFVDEGDLLNLIKGIVYCQRCREHTLGSTSPVGRLYDRYLELHPEEDESLTQWIIDNRVNDYDPFGSSVRSTAVSSKEYKQADKVRRVIAAENEANQHRGFRHSVKADMELKRIERNLPKAIERGDHAAVEAMTKKKNRILGQK